MGSEPDLRDNALPPVSDISSVVPSSDLSQLEKGVDPPVCPELFGLHSSSSEGDIAEVAHFASGKDAEVVSPPATSDVVPPSVVADACDESNVEDEVSPLDLSQSIFDTEITDVVSGQRKRPLPDSSGDDEAEF